jgi:hypothetical protein
VLTRARPFAVRQGLPDLKLHLGCFDRPIEGWLNTDVTPHIWVARVPLLAEVLGRAGRLTPERLEQHRAGVFRQVRYLDVSRRFPLADRSVRAIFSSHMLEHLSYDVARHCLRESWRLLAPGGVVRVVVPDLDNMIERYDPDRADGWVYSMFEARQKQDRNRHRWMYNERSLAAVLRDVGFQVVDRCDFGQGRCPDLDRIDNRPGSLFMEAQR